MNLLAAFNVLLYRYTDQEDILIGSPIANRNRAELERMLGLFVNTLVLRNNLSGNPSFRELLHRVREVTLDAYAHQDLPFEMLVEELQPERDLSRNPLYEVMFVLQNTPSTVQEALPYFTC
jgi:non-ribosomal peptide synthetase component F